MTLQRYKEERNGVQPNDEGNLVKFDDVVKFKKDLLQALENTYQDMYDADDYASGKFDAADKVKAMFNKAGINNDNTI